jgi:7-cyano-7-deazaguanine reductase
LWRARPEQGRAVKPLKKIREDNKSASRSRASLNGLDRRYDVGTQAAIDVAVLETIPYEYPGKKIAIHIDTDEFTAVCPYSGLPDFATLRIDYVPDRILLELRSVKYYLLSYRSVGIYQEHAVNRILRDLSACCQPKWMSVTADYKIRGGVHSVAVAETGRKRP